MESGAWHEVVAMRRRSAAALLGSDQRHAGLLLALTGLPAVDRDREVG
jgi:hypothetical protein